MLASDSQELFLRRKQHVTTLINRELKRGHKRLLERKSILNECRNWEIAEHTGQLLQSNLFRIEKGSSEVTVEDWLTGETKKISLDPYEEPYKQVAAYFKRSHKLRTGEKHAEKQLLFRQEELLRLQQQQLELELISNMEGLAAYCRCYHLKWQRVDTSIPRLDKSPPKPYRIYHTPSGIEVWVGRSAKENDQMTFQYANGSDLWFHVADYPGSHVILRCGKDKEAPSQESIEYAAELALRFSKIKDLSGNVVQAQVKSLKRVKSAPGKVLLSKDSKTLFIHKAPSSKM